MRSLGGGSIELLKMASAEGLVIDGPARKYPPVTAGDYLSQRVAANFKAY